MMTSSWRHVLERLSRSEQAGRRPRVRARARISTRPMLERLEDRTLPSVSIAPSNNNGNGYTGMDFNQSSGGYIPPDTQGAAGPTNYVETVNQSISIYNPKSTGASQTFDSLSHFWGTVGGLPPADNFSGFSDPVVTYDDNMAGQTAANGRFIIGDQNVDAGFASVFDIAVSKSASPATLTTADWNFYQINTQQGSGVHINNQQSGFFADYPGNMGYTRDALVVTLNQFGISSNHVDVISVNASDLLNGVSQSNLHSFQNNLNDLSVRPATEHDVASGAPEWLVSETERNGVSQSTHITVYKMTNVLSSSPTFTPTRLSVNPYTSTSFVPPLQPDGTAVTTHTDSRIQKAALANNTLVATHAVSQTSTEDAAQWYAIDVSSGTPTLSQQGDVNLGNNTYAMYPSIDINPSGQIGLNFEDSGTAAGQFASMYVTGHHSSDSAGTMQTPVLVPAGTGQANYHDFGFLGMQHQGDLSGINVDPNDGSFWASQEFANTDAQANWGTAIANFTLSPLPPADLSVTKLGPSSVTAGTSATYTITFSNLGPNSASNVVLTDTLPTGSQFVSMTQNSGPDSFTQTTGSGTVTETNTAPVASGNTDVFTVIVFAPTSLGNGATFNNTVTVSSNSNSDPNSSNNTSTVTGTIVNNSASADLAVTDTGPSSSSEGNNVTYTLTVTNNGPNDSPGVTLTDTLPGIVNFISATASQGTFSVSGGVVTFNMNTINNGANATATIVGQFNEDGYATNSATASSSTADPNPNNNTATATTSVAEGVINVSRPRSVFGLVQNNVIAGTFTHASGVEPTSAFSATINWGDGKTSAGTITQSGSTYVVRGSHTYSSGTFHPVSISVSETGNDPVFFDGSINVYGPPIIVPTGTSPAATSGSASSDGSSPSPSPGSPSHSAKGSHALGGMFGGTNLTASDQLFMMALIDNWLVQNGWVL
jgi:uncharacterized repeat protein (TIGR01451 family)